MYVRNRMGAGMQLAILLMLCGACLVLAGFAVILLGTQMLGLSITELSVGLNKILNDPTYVDFSRLVQGVSTGIAMAVPAFVLGLIVNRQPLQYLRFSTTLTGKQVFYIVLLLVPAVMMSGSLSELNKMIPVSAEWSARFKQMEQAYSEQVMVLADMKTTGDYVLSLLVLALLPAIFEEMLFRGAFQQVLTRLFKNVVVAIVVTSIIFSAFHMSFYGFLPRLFLGVVLGYIFYYSQNIWLSILLHFLNNAFVLTQMFMLSRSGRLTVEALEENTPLLYGFVAIPIVVMLFLAFKRESEKVHAYHVLNELNKKDKNNKEEQQD